MKKPKLLERINKFTAPSLPPTSKQRSLSGYTVVVGLRYSGVHAPSTGRQPDPPLSNLADSLRSHHRDLPPRLVVSNDHIDGTDCSSARTASFGPTSALSQWQTRHLTYTTPSSPTSRTHVCTASKRSMALARVVHSSDVGSVGMMMAVDVVADIVMLTAMEGKGVEGRWGEREGRCPFGMPGFLVGSWTVEVNLSPPHLDIDMWFQAWVKVVVTLRPNSRRVKVMREDRWAQGLVKGGCYCLRHAAGSSRTGWFLG